MADEENKKTQREIPLWLFALVMTAVLILLILLLRPPQMPDWTFSSDSSSALLLTQY